MDPRTQASGGDLMRWRPRGEGEQPSATCHRACAGGSGTKSLSVVDFAIGANCFRLAFRFRALRLHIRMRAAAQPQVHSVRVPDQGSHVSPRVSSIWCRRHLDTRLTVTTGGAARAQLGSKGVEVRINTNFDYVVVGCPSSAGTPLRGLRNL